MNMLKNALIINRKRSMYQDKRWKLKKTSTKILSKLSKLEDKSSKNAIMITLSSLPILMTYLYATTFGFIMYVPSGYLSAISKKKMA